MKTYKVTISESSGGGEKKLFEFESDSDAVLYTMDVDAYQEGKKLLSSSLDYMNRVSVEETESIPTQFVGRPL